MKTLIIIFAVAATSLICSSCCKEPYPVAGFTVSYPNLSNFATLKAIRTDKNNLSTILDTISIAELNTSNNFTTLVEFENEQLNYILYFEDNQYIDTISEILVERKGCNSKIKDFQYKLNGQVRTDKKLTIN